MNINAKILARINKLFIELEKLDNEVRGSLDKLNHVISKTTENLKKKNKKR